MRTSGSTPADIAQPPVTSTVFGLLFAISASHLMNDMIQALLPSIYPLLRNSYALSFTQLGLITFTFQVTASLLQPVVGLITDRKSLPYSLPIGMTLTTVGLVSLSSASSFATILFSAGLIGAGSAVFHPEASRIAHMAAGKRRGLAQSLFQVGGNAGSAIGPLLAALIIVPHGQRAIIGFSAVSLLAILVLWNVGRWQGRNLHRIHRRSTSKDAEVESIYSRKTVIRALLVLVVLTFSKYVYLASLSSYYTFYLMDRFHISVRDSQYHLFLLLLAVAIGTIVGGPVGDRFGRKKVIWVSILGVAPFSLLLPHVGLGMTGVLSVIIGLILASAFSAILVYAQELLPGKVGMVAGLFFGLAFGIAGIGSAALGKLADMHGINFVFQICAFLPLLGFLTVFLPEIRADRD
ncbi:MFS transporter [Luteolibacter pohnpeiensis]|uniref:MFS transporter n=1 Tax=Luteolibacter pohnpeiensis TaxID=454153 RepID=A0A934S1X6_9BACT|nr:MFS transporter [Luteolibacter pohnpeiensis]MBK1881710.1 MFS transporter [Luteolibacter pohnpeiensis]